MVVDRLQRVRRALLTLALSVLFGAAIYLGTTFIASPARHTMVAASGGLRFVDSAGNPLPGASVRILCYANAGATQPLADLQTTTDAGGHPTPGVPMGCNNVAALRLLHTQPSGKPNHGPAYWVYATSWAPFAPALLPSTGDVTITLSNPLVLFNIVASVEWQPAAASPFVGDLMQGLNSASAYLYSLSEGQMAIGPVSIRMGGMGWESADLRFRAANDYRPSARVGGIVSATTPYTTTALTNTVYVPGEILLGRYWDGSAASDPATGNWKQPEAYRTLMHEWGHYAMFLYDEYQFTGPMGSSETYCTCANLPDVGKIPGACGGVAPSLATSAMAFHYTASKLWLKGTPLVCMGSEQWLVHGEQDWQTLGKWSRIQGLPIEWLHVPAALASGPVLGIAGNLFGRSPGYLSFMPAVKGGAGLAQSQIYIEPNITVTVGAVLTPVELLQLAPQVYVSMPVQAGNGRIVYEGTTDGSRQLPNRLGSMTLYGVPSGLGHARIFIDRYTSSAGVGGRFIYPGPGGGDPPLANGQTLHAVTDTWRSSLNLAYGLTGRLFRILTVTLTSLDPLAPPPLAQLCLPDAASGCVSNSLWHQTMKSSGLITWTATFTAPAGAELPHYGIVDVQASGGRELMRWYLAYGGVGPAHIDGNAPLADGLVSLDAVQAVPGVRNLVAIMPAANFRALHAPLPAGVHGIVGSPLDMRVMLPDAPPPYVAVNPNADNSSVAYRPSLQADFTASPAAGVAPLTVHFTNLSTGSNLQSLWTFGDGGRSTAPNPVYTYTTPGVYTVSLTVTSGGIPNNVTRPNYIRVRRPGTFVVTFFYNPATLRRITIGTNQLVVLHFDPRANAWEVIQSSAGANGGSTALNWLATPPTDRDGIFALGWTGAP